MGKQDASAERKVTVTFTVPGLTLDQANALRVNLLAFQEGNAVLAPVVAPREALEAAAAYWDRVAKHSGHLPGTFYWHEVWDAMVSAAALTRAA